AISTATRHRPPRRRRPGRCVDARRPRLIDVDLDSARLSTSREQVLEAKPTTRRISMPVAVIDVPQGLGKEAKKRLHKEVFEAMHEAWLIPDTRVFLREFDPEQSTSTDGVPGAIRPVVGYEGPPLPVEVKQRLAGRVWKAIAEAYELPRDIISLPSGK